MARRRGTTGKTLRKQPTGKPCKDCGSTTRKTYTPGPRCVTCERNRRNKTSEARRLAYVAVQYNLTPERYFSLLARFEGKCWMCRKSKARQIDHDHSCCSGKTSCGKCVRGILCGPCNKFLGYIRDSLQVALNMAWYLENYERERSELGEVT